MLIIAKIKVVKSKWLNLRCLIGVWILLAFVLALGFNGRTQSFLIHNPQTYIKTFEQLLQFTNNEENIKITTLKYGQVKYELEKHYGEKWPFNEILKKLDFITSLEYLDVAISVYNKSTILIGNFKLLQDILSSFNEFPLAISDELKSETLVGGYFVVNKLTSGAFCENWKRCKRKECVMFYKVYCVKGIIDRENRSETRSKIMKT